MTASPLGSYAAPRVPERTGISTSIRTSGFAIVDASARRPPHSEGANEAELLMRIPDSPVTTYTPPFAMRPTRLRVKEWC